MSEVIRKVDVENPGAPHPALGGMLEIRYTNTEGSTEVWMVPNHLWGESSEGLLRVIRRSHAIKLAFLDSGVDSRIGLLRAKAEADREHIESHHDELTMLYHKEFGTGYACQLSVGETGETSAQAKA